jgi:hypothetical protein
MNYTNVTNPEWANENHTVINCNVLFNDFAPEYLPFTANPSDTSNPSSKKIFNECVEGIWGEIAEYVPPTPYIPTASDNKQIATQLLQQTDWTSVADVGNPEMSNPYLSNQAEFIAYRNSVRQYAIYPVEGNIDWPVMPQQDWKTV